MHRMGQRDFKTKLVDAAISDAFGSEEGREAFRRFNVQFDGLISEDGTMQGAVEDICDPLLPKVGGIGRGGGVGEGFCFCFC